MTTAQDETHWDWSKPKALKPPSARRATSPEWRPSRAWPTLALLLAFGAGMLVQHCVEAESVPRVAEEPVQ